MPRKFPAYTPTVLKPTPEQLARVPKGLQVKYGINRVKQKNGTIYVTERAYYIDPKTHQSHAIASVKIGKISKGETEMVWTFKSKTPAKTSPAIQLVEKAQEVLADERQEGKVQFPLPLFWAVCILCTMTGRSDAHSIADYWNANSKQLFRGYEGLYSPIISADTVQRLMTLLSPEQAIEMARLFEAEEQEDQSIGKTPRVVSVDGQAVRASRNSEDRCNYLLNLFNGSDKRFMGQCLIAAKQGETTATPELLKAYDLEGTIVTADALFTKAGMFEAIIEKKADYCIPVKNNAKTFVKDIDEAFTKVLNAPEGSEGPSIKTLRYDTEIGHGRIEERIVDVLPASLLPEKQLKCWAGLDEGCIVQYHTRRTNKKTGEVETDIKRAVTSLRWDAEDLAKTIGFVMRRHWAIENSLHWVLDVAFRQDRIQCRNGNYLFARTWLNKIVLNMLRNYKEQTKSTKSFERLMVEMHDLSTAKKCLKMALS